MSPILQKGRSVLDFFLLKMILSTSRINQKVLSFQEDGQKRKIVIKSRISELNFTKSEGKVRFGQLSF